ncbi:unnamed protein product [Owenia fusiformis]|uniref:Uncharacterized protein n=1 Tax=Owenia fusiformis TaxID=6347 RepID=A0A8J1UTD5_OWEFU|nr:unnamed protein product [Owenia fusiformis]
MAQQHSTSMTEAHLATLHACRVEIEKGLDVEHIMGRCRQEGVITKAIQDQIRAQTTPMKKCREFLDILETRNTDAFDVFVTALKEENYEHLASKLENMLPIQSFTIAKSNLKIASMKTATLKNLKAEEQSVTQSSIAEVEALCAQLRSDLGFKNNQVNPTTTSLDLSQCSLTLKQKIELPNSCRGLCFTPNGEIAVVIMNLGIVIYRKDFSIKFKFKVDKPVNVVCLPTGEFIVSSRENNCVKLFDSNGQYKEDICQQVNCPIGLAYNHQLGLVVTGCNPNSVYLCTSSGEVTHTITNDEFKLLGRVHINPYNLHLLVSENTTNTLHCLKKDGTQVFKFKGQGDDKLNDPRGIFVTEQHILLVDAGNHRVLLLNHKGDFIKVLLTKQQHDLYGPTGILVDSTGNILVGESHRAVDRKDLLYVFKGNT